MARLIGRSRRCVLVHYGRWLGHRKHPRPVILQDFESTWQTITTRMPDIFAAGYGGIYTPHRPVRAESGNQSVGYDVYDRYRFR